MIFAEMEVLANQSSEAREFATANARKARRKFRTEPIAHRVEIQKPVDPRKPELGLHWVEIDKPFAP